MKTHFSKGISGRETDFVRSYFYEKSSQYTLDDHLRSHIVETAIGMASENIELFFSSPTEDFLDEILHRAGKTAIMHHASRFENTSNSEPSL